MAQEVRSWRSDGVQLGVVVIPLLFETQAESEFDVVVCVACDSSTQNLRLKERGWAEKEIELRIAAQLPIDEKMAKADYIVWSDGSLDILAEQLDRVLQSISHRDRNCSAS